MHRPSLQKVAFCAFFAKECNFSISCLNCPNETSFATAGEATRSPARVPAQLHPPVRLITISRSRERRDCTFSTAGMVRIWGRIRSCVVPRAPPGHDIVNLCTKVVRMSRCLNDRTSPYHGRLSTFAALVLFLLDVSFSSRRSARRRPEPLKTSPFVRSGSWRRTLSRQERTTTP